jgi:hypothetical protein
VRLVVLRVVMGEAVLSLWRNTTDALVEEVLGFVVGR